MTYDEDVADRLRELLARQHAVTEKKMFGGLAFMIAGHMVVAASGQGGLLLRVDPVETDQLTNDPHAERFIMRGRPMNGWLRIDAAGVVSDADLDRWVQHGISYVGSLSPKHA